MKLYVINYKYYDTYEKKHVEGMWLLGCENVEKVHENMELNNKQFKRYGYEISSYKFREINETDNGYKVYLIK